MIVPPIGTSSSNPPVLAPRPAVDSRVCNGLGNVLTRTNRAKQHGWGQDLNRYSYPLERSLPSAAMCTTRTSSPRKTVPNERLSIERLRERALPSAGGFNHHRPEPTAGRPGTFFPRFDDNGRAASCARFP